MMFTDADSALDESAVFHTGLDDLRPPMLFVNLIIYKEKKNCYKCLCSVLLMANLNTNGHCT